MKTTIRNHRLLSVVTALMLVLTMIPLNFIVSAVSYDANGFGDDGTYQPCSTDENGNYLIANAGNLYWFAGLVNGTLDGVTQNTSANGVVTEDITVNEGEVGACNGTKADTWRDWTPIGLYNSSVNKVAFSGNFDGQNHTISGLYYNSDTSHAGLFGFVNNFETVIENIKISNSYIKYTSGYSGSVVGYVISIATVNNCETESSLIYGSYAGGIVGYYGASGGKISHCTNISTIVDSPNHFAGGIVGYSYGIIEYCINEQAQNFSCYGGGIAGYSEEPVSKCTNSGKIIGANSVGGICGKSNGRIYNCYNKGEIFSSSRYAGGISGELGMYNYPATVENCYSTANVTATTAEKAYPIGHVNTTDSTITNCYYLDTSVTSNADNGTSQKAEEFESGEVCYLLNGDQTKIVFGQNLDNGKTKEYFPVFIADDYSNQVFTSKNSELYSNNILHNYVNGFCEDCNKYQPCVQREDGTYEIANAGNLYWFAGLVNGTLDGVTQNKSANAVVTADIAVNKGDVGSYNGTDTVDWLEWTPIDKYDGTFNGGNFTISGIYCDFVDFAALFETIESTGVVKNIKVNNSCFTVTDGDTSTIAFYNNGIVENCNIGNAVGGISCGIVCENRGLVKDCTNNSDISFAFSTGGIALINYGTIEYCVNNGNITGENTAGGIAGVSIKGTIKNCINTGKITTTTSFDIYAGGIAGQIGNATNDYSATIENCYSTGTVTAANTANAYPIGYLGNGTISNSYYLNDTTVANTYTGVIKKSVEQFASGEVAYLLNGDQSVLTFGQLIETDTYPVFLSDEETQTVYQVTFKQYGDTEGTNTKYAYTNENKTVSIPTDFVGKKLLVLDTNGNFTQTEFTADTLVTENITVSYIPAPTYTVTIPETVDFGECSRELENAAGKDRYNLLEMKISATTRYLYLNNKKLTVTVNSDFKLSNGTDELDYQMFWETKSGVIDNNYNFAIYDKIQDGRVLLEKNNVDTNSENTITNTFTFVLDKSKITKALNNLTDTLTFTVALSDAE